MKNFWFIFSIFLLSLTVYPCSENDNCEKNINSEVCKAENQKNKTQEPEHCTPFCNCSHCPASVFFINNVSYTLKKKVILFQEEKLLSFYTSIYTKKIADKIWQPPKIS